MPQVFTPPNKGAMFLFDYITPPLDPGLYRLETSTEVGYDSATQNMKDDKYFEVVGPRFSLPPADLAGVFPPRNGRGPFQNSLAQCVIRRRTLPWERKLDSQNKIGNTTLSNPLPASYPVPWMALLVFEEGEFSLLENVPLESVVPPAVFQRMQSPANIICNAVEADASLVASIMPSKEELQLLAHIRWVNIEDRELNVEGSDGWFAVVMANRLPRPGAKCRACLVSLEERADLVKKDPPETHVPQSVVAQPVVGPTFATDKYRVAERSKDVLIGKLQVIATKVRMVLLHSWEFTCEGKGTFYNLMQDLDVGMIGKTKVAGRPSVTDTGHLRMKLRDRSGVEETVWYRGPLVPFELTRDVLGPYHSADQCRRATPETGAEDISYAAAFEVGRLLAAADARLAQELMRWRREMYRQSSRMSLITALEAIMDLELPPLLAQKLELALIPVLAKSSIYQFVSNPGPIADRYGLAVASKAIGMNVEAVSKVWNLAVADAQVILGGVPATLGLEVTTPPATKRANTNLDAVVADIAANARLTSARDRMVTNLITKLGGQI